MEGWSLKPYRIDFCCVGPVSDLRYQDHIREALSTGFPVVERRPLRWTHLAVAGGGPSLVNHLETLRNWQGEIWAINQTASWLKSQGIDSTLFSVDAGDDLPQWTEGVDKALLASICHPELFRKLKGKEVRIFHTEHYEPADFKATGGPSSACRVPKLALALGHGGVTFFGCEGSFETVSHAYRNENTSETRPKQVIVKAGGKLYRTGPDYMLTSEYLAEVIRTFPHVFDEQSGGLLRAMIQNPDTWEIVALSETMKNELDPEALPYVFPHEKWQKERSDYREVA